MNTILLALVLVELTLADGAKVYINPSFVTRVYPTREAVEGGINKYVVQGAKCVVTFGDGKFNAVIEPCEVVRLKLEGKMK